MEPRRDIRRNNQGLTLLEVLVVLGIVAAIAGIGVQVFTGVTDSTEENIVRAEMREVSSAIQRFRRDTGFYPKDGIFGTTDDTELALPANLGQLFIEPVNGGTPVMSYDPATGTGWRGPYMTELDSLTVVVGDNLTATGSGDPTAGTQETVRAVGDPFVAAPVGGVFAWQNASGVTTAQLGRPYYYFIDGTNVTGCIAPCLLSAGPNGTYEAGAGDDIVVGIGALN
ncbi:MAG: prepilin-type N-terminal cleavage/methylation domain-containing protein [Pseudomonadota bacterium]